MPSEKEKLTVKGLIERILEPNANIKETTSRQQARLTTLASLILAAASFIAGIIGLIAGSPISLIAGFFILATIMSVATATGRSENFLIGSIFLVSGMMLGGFIIGSAFTDVTGIVIILIATIVPAFTLSLVLLPVLAIIIIAVIVLITIGVLPLMANVSASTELILFFGLTIVEGVFVLIAWFRETTETQQQDEIGSLRGRLEERVEERTRYTRIAADIAQEIISSPSLEELLRQAASLTTARFGFSFVGIFLADDTGHYVELKAAQGSEAERLLRTGKRVKFGPPSLLGWVAENKQQRLATRLAEDSLQLEAELLAGNQSELGIPILSSNKLLGVMDVQSTRTTVFDNETIVVLQMLASQIAIAIQNIRVLEVEQGGIHEVIDAYLAGFKIGQIGTENEIYQILQTLFSKTPYVAMFLTGEGEVLKVNAKSDVRMPEGQPLPESISVPVSELEPFLTAGIFIGERNRLNALPYNLVSLLRQLQIFSAALIPMLQLGSIEGVLVLGTREKNPLVQTTIQPYINLVSQIGTTLDRIHDAQKKAERSLEMETTTQVSSEIARCKTEKDVLEAVQHIFKDTPTTAILLVAENNNLRVSSSANLTQVEKAGALPEWVNVLPEELFKQLGNKILVEEFSKLSTLYYAQYHPELQKFIENEANDLPVIHPELIKFIDLLHFNSVALLPVTQNEALDSLIIVGTAGNLPLVPSVKSYSGISELILSAFDRIRGAGEIEHRLNEDEIIILMSQEITSIRELPPLYSALHTHIRQTLGNVNFLVALFHENTDSISIPYLFEKGADNNDTINKIEPFPVGEGLTSILIRTKQPLMLVEDTEKRAIALGAKITGKPPKSWLGTPMVVADEVIGAIVVQDIEHEFAFTDTDLRFLTTLSSQVAGTIYNTRLLEETRNRAIQLQTAAEIARDISGSLDLGELLKKAVTLIRERFNFYHAAIFLVDSMNEYAVIREATGEAGTQMKRAGHKLKVGSKSIVGYVTGSGEPLVVNDTNRDATYFANPLLPETRAEVTIPLKVGQRILGALDVQSAQPYAFGEEDISVLRILSDQMAVAVINSELFADTQEHLSQHRLLHHVTTAAASGTTLEEALNSAVQGLQVTLGGDRVSILLADKPTKTLGIKSFAGYSEEVGQLKVPYGEGITGWVAVHLQPQRINDVTQDPRYIEVGSNVRSELAVPLSYRGELLGVLNVESDQTGAYNENDEEMLGTIGGSLAAIISNARLIEQVRRQVDHERMLYEVTSKIRRSTDMKTIMATTTSELSKVLGAQRAQIKLEFEDQTKPESRAGSN
jgi:GAF domain-containing protein